MINEIIENISTIRTFIKSKISTIKKRSTTSRKTMKHMKGG